MSEQSQAGKIQTVLGLIEPESLGITMTHEHLLIDLTNYFEAPAEASQRGYIHRPVTIDILSDIRRVWKYNIDNLQLLDEQAAIEEVLKYKYAGGNAIVDATSIGIGRDPLALARISRATGLNVIMGASYYVPSSHPPDMGDRTESEIANEIISDLTVGVGETGIRSGVIGEIGCWWPPGPNEPKILRASAYAQSQTGAPILIHPGYHNKAHDKIMATLIEEGPTPRTSSWTPGHHSKRHGRIEESGRDGLLHGIRHVRQRGHLAQCPVQPGKGKRCPATGPNPVPDGAGPPEPDTRSPGCLHQVKLHTLWGQGLRAHP